MLKRISQTGYTLIELLLYMAIVGILLSAVSAFFGVTADARIKNQSVNEVNSQGTYALDYMAQTIRNASSITSPAAAGTDTQLTLVVPTSSLSPTVFNLSSGVLQVKEGTAAAVALTSSRVQVTSMTIKNLTRSGTTGCVQISLTIARVNANNRNEYDYTRTFTTTATVRP
jgi:prepilin-type N-terminal cleavage/methylation domain-containing protein